MTKEQLQERIEQLKQAILIHQGALQDCQYWLEQLDTKEDNGKD